jgi:hypothetical protein
MKGIADKLADTRERIAECADRISEQQSRLVRGNSDEAAEAGLLLGSAADALRELCVYKASLERLIEVTASRRD